MGGAAMTDIGASCERQADARFGENSRGLELRRSTDERAYLAQSSRSIRPTVVEASARTGR